MDVKKVMVIGPMGSGKSWFLNRVLERKVFAEGNSNDPCTLEMNSRSKRIQDNVNGLNYELVLVDTPGLKSTAGKNITQVLDKIKLDELNHLVLVCCLPLKKNSLKKYLKDISKRLIPHLSGSSDSFTLVVNKIPAGISDEKVLKFVGDVGKSLKCNVDRYISIQMNESPRNCQFNYVLRTAKGRFESATVNFLEIVGRSKRITLVKNKPAHKSKQSPLRKSMRKKAVKSGVLIELREAEAAQRADQRSVIVIGPRGSGKSWLLNKIFERRQFAEAVSIQPCTTRLDRATKNIRDMVNGLEYRLELVDSPALSEALDDMAGVFNQVVLVLKMGHPLDSGLQSMLKMIGANLKQLRPESAVSFTLVINNITSSISNQGLVDFFKQIQAFLGPIDECICVGTDEKIRDAVFRYLTNGEDGYEFHDGNFLAAVGTSPALEFTFKNLSKKKPAEAMDFDEPLQAKSCWPFSCCK